MKKKLIKLHLDFLDGFGRTLKLRFTDNLTITTPNLILEIYFQTLIIPEQ
jgi:hypothetical protein